MHREESQVDSPAAADSNGKCNTQDNASENIGASRMRWLCNLLILLAAVIQLSRIVQVQSSTGEVPFFSANDRSRWCTIAALSVNGSYEIDELLEIRDPQTRRRTWYTIDLVRHRGADGKQHFYSSKPPLLPTLYAGVYLAIRGLTGATLTSSPFVVAPLLLICVNLIPLVAFWWLMMAWIRQRRLSDWATVILCVLLTWGTYLSTFVTTLNNHLPAAIAVGISLWCIDRIALQGDRRWRWFAVCGLATSFAGANELPALSWIAAAGAILFIVDPRRTLAAYAPALVPVAVAFFAANHAAHGEWIPAYAHRDVGKKLVEFPLESNISIEQLPPDLVREQLRSLGRETSASAEINAARRPGVYEFWDPENQIRFALRREATAASDGRQVIGLFEWGDWYDYPGSYWTAENKQGVDKGEANRAIYIFHSLLGHHGIFSLTPFWFVALVGCLAVWRSRATWNIFIEHRLLIATAIAATSVVAIAFYMSRPLEDRNYGGVASGFRWAFWLIPLWIWLATEGLRLIQAAWTRRLVEVCLLISVFSACYPWDNPWTSPWLMQLWQAAPW